MTTQLKMLKDEIDAVTKKIDEEKEEWKTATPEKAAVYLKSIDVLNEALKGLRASRDRIIDAATAAPAPGKNPPLALDASVPPLHANSQHPPLVVASLSSSTRFKPCFEPGSKPWVDSRLCVRARVVCPSCEEGWVVACLACCAVAVDAPLVACMNG